MVGQRDTIAKYRILEEISTGSFCSVFHCLDVRLEREVAIKTVRRYNGGDPRLARERLQREAVVRAQVEHPHVLPLYHIAGAMRSPSLVGPWMGGGALGRILGPAWDAQAVVELAIQVGSALDAVHRAGWIHGDLNSGAVLFSTDGRAVIGDFGSALRCGEVRGRPGGPHAVEITPHTAAPEVWRGGSAEPSSDLYALCALLYRLMTGNFPFEATDWALTGQLHCEAELASVAAGYRSLSDGVARVMSRGLAKSPGERFGSGAELAEELRLAVALKDDEPETTGVALEGAAEALEDFAGTLGAEDQIALTALLKSVEVANAISAAEVEALTAEVFGPGAALVALEDCGVAEVLADGPISARTLAARTGLDLQRVRRLLDALCAIGLAGRERGRYSLPECLAVAYGNARQRGVQTRPIAEAARFWNHLSTWARTGEPCVRMEGADGSAYARAGATLGHINQALATRLAAELRNGAEVPPGAAILDVGAGTAVWSIALAAPDPEATVTALDREPVLRSAERFAEGAGIRERMSTIAGDWRDAPLERDGYDVILLANVCHLESLEDVARMLKRLHGALRRKGILVVIDTIPETHETAPASVLLHGLRMGLRSAHGDIHNLQQYRKCLQAAGLRDVRMVELVEGNPNFRAIVARHLRTETTSPVSKSSSPPRSSKRDRPPHPGQKPSRNGKTNRPQR